MRRPRQQIANRLWIARKKIGLGQKSVARLLGRKSPSPISEYETGRLIPNLRTALTLAVIYQTALPDLYMTMQREIEEEVAERRKKLPMTHIQVQETAKHA